MSSWATTVGRGVASASKGPTPNTWSMCPCEKTTVLTGSGLHWRTASCSAGAPIGLPLSKSTSSPPAWNVMTLPKPGWKPTPSATSSTPVPPEPIAAMLSSASPFQTSSA